MPCISIAWFSGANHGNVISSCELKNLPNIPF